MLVSERSWNRRCGKQSEENRAHARQRLRRRLAVGPLDGFPSGPNSLVGGSKLLLGFSGAEKWRVFFYQKKNQPS